MNPFVGLNLWSLVEDTKMCGNMSIDIRWSVTDDDDNYLCSTKKWAWLKPQSGNSSGHIFTFCIGLINSASRQPSLYLWKIIKDDVCD